MKKSESSQLEVRAQLRYCKRERERERGGGGEKKNRPTEREGPKKS